MCNTRNMEMVRVRRRWCWCRAIQSAKFSTQLVVWYMRHQAARAPPFCVDRYLPKRFRVYIVGNRRIVGRIVSSFECYIDDARAAGRFPWALPRIPIVYAGLKPTRKCAMLIKGTFRFKRRYALYSIFCLICSFGGRDLSVFDWAISRTV